MKINPPLLGKRRRIAFGRPLTRQLGPSYIRKLSYQQRMRRRGNLIPKAHPTMTLLLERESSSSPLPPSSHSSIQIVKTTITTIMSQPNESISLEQLASHNTLKSLWIAVHGHGRVSTSASQGSSAKIQTDQLPSLRPHSLQRRPPGRHRSPH